MPSCGTCGKRWPDEYRVCPDDGASLVPSGFAATAASASGSIAADLARSDDDDLAPGSMAGEYQIEAKIGQGGMGSVYGARHPLIGKRAAIKVISSELSASQAAVDRFVLEAQAVNQVGHPNIVDVFGFGRLPDGRSFFVMEWLHGETLRSRLERPLPFGEAIDLIDTITQALQAAHEAGVVHRDLKPDNVFLCETKGARPVVKLLDFGLAKLSGPSDGRIERTRTGVVMGTPLYISPEQAKGIKIDAATDVYSLGVMAYEMFSGRVPFLAGSAVEIMSMHITDAPQAPSLIATGLPPGVDSLLLAMMAKEPSERPTPPQIREQLAALRNLAPHVSSVGAIVAPNQWAIATPAPGSRPPSLAPASSLARSDAPMPSPTSAEPPRKSRAGLFAVLALLGVGAAGAVTYALIGGAPSPRKHHDPVARIEPPVETQPVAVTPPDAPVAAPPDAKPADPKPVVATKPAELKPVTKPKQVATKPAATTGTVDVKIEGVQFGSITVDGELKATKVAEQTLELAPGDHKIVVKSVRSSGSGTRHVHVDAGSHQDVTITLPKLRRPVRDPFPGE